MIRTLVSTSVLFVFVLSLPAQSLKSTFGNDVLTARHLTGLVKADGHGYVFYSTEDADGNIFLERQHLDEGKLSQVSVLYNAEKGNGDPEKIFYFDDQIIVITRLDDEKAKTISFSEASFDYYGNNGVPFQEILKIQLGKKQAAGLSSVYVSPDHSHFMISCSTGAQETMLYGFDSNWKQTIQQQVMLQASDKSTDWSFDAVGITSMGVIHYVVEKSVTLKDATKSTYRLYAIRTESKDSVLLTVPGAGLGSYAIVEQNNDLLVMGVYDLANTSGGIYALRYSVKDKQIVKETSTAFTQQLFVTPGVKPDEGAAVPDFGDVYEVDTIIRIANGNYDLLVQTAATEKKTMADGDPYEYITAPNYYIVNMSGDGYINWISTIYRQHSASRPVISDDADRFGEFATSAGERMRKDIFGLFDLHVTVMDNTMYILGNDDPINTQQPTNEDNVVAVNGPGKLGGVIISIGEKGNIGKTVLKDSNGTPVNLYVPFAFADGQIMCSMYYTEGYSGVVMLRK